MDQAFDMEPATITDRQQHVPPCEDEEMTKQQAVVDQYREQQTDVKSKSVPAAKQTGSWLVYSGEQQKVLELLAGVNCPVAQWDGYNTVWWYKSLRVRKYIKQKGSTGSYNHHGRFTYRCRWSIGCSSIPNVGRVWCNSTTEVLKWTDLTHDSVSDCVNAYSYNTQHGQSLILSLLGADESSYSAWTCGMLTKELLQNPMLMVTSRLFVWHTGSKTSKIGRVYNSSQLLQCWV